MTAAGNRHIPPAASTAVNISTSPLDEPEAEDTTLLPQLNPQIHVAASGSTLPMDQSRRRVDQQHVPIDHSSHQSRGDQSVRMSDILQTDNDAQDEGQYINLTDFPMPDMRPQIFRQSGGAVERQKRKQK